MITLFIYTAVYSVAYSVVEMMTMGIFKPLLDQLKT